ncbi:hypothetical protein AXF42_Ash000442 [Apostasia shenzhenica]|uniref:Uncharacterized protein n=1 Tax=Apostasia shenzhenica TaxID=1088818 RepID=A0A2I0AGD7_9ASPA|nr:hypothetical protein AXF42_Ash000442 [Apostasia shenzhenica]
MASNEMIAASAAAQHYGDTALISRLSVQQPDDGEDADDEESGKASPSAADDEDDDRVASHPSTPQHRQLLRLTRGLLRECASETEARSSGGGRRRRRWARDRKVERKWEARRCRAGGDAGGGAGEDSGECVVVVRPGGGSGRKIRMDIDEVRACRDLGLEIPRDFTVEIPGGLSGNSSSGDSPISGPGECSIFHP